MKNTLFYKYVRLDGLEEMRDEFKSELKDLGIQGTILLAEEGINGCLTGDDNNIEAFKRKLTSDERFSDMEFKEAETDGHGFRKVKVKIRKEIVTSNFGVDASDAADYVEPSELKRMFDDGEDFVMVDMRNNYESDIGVFDKTVALDIDTFREVPKAMKQLEGMEDKKIVAYCTGGVRCEKGTAFLKKKGFNDVRHLHGGILRYGKEVGNENWNGKCFVFDSRGAVDIDPERQSEPISKCVLCNLPTADYHNCRVVECDRRFLACSDCLSALKGCCSKVCRGSMKVKVSVRGL